MGRGREGGAWITKKMNPQQKSNVASIAGFFFLLFD
jgi:hypothetical protein